MKCSMIFQSSFYEYRLWNPETEIINTSTDMLSILILRVSPLKLFSPALTPSRLKLSILILRVSPLKHVLGLVKLPSKVLSILILRVSPLKRITSASTADVRVTFQSSFYEYRLWNDEITWRGDILLFAFNPHFTSIAFETLKSLNRTLYRKGLSILILRVSPLKHGKKESPRSRNGLSILILRVSPLKH